MNRKIVHLPGWISNRRENERMKEGKNERMKEGKNERTPGKVIRRDVGREQGIL
jgi:hypothetical protein